MFVKANHYTTCSQKTKNLKTENDADSAIKIDGLYRWCHSRHLEP